MKQILLRNSVRGHPNGRERLQSSLQAAHHWRLQLVHFDAFYIHLKLKRLCIKSWKVALKGSFYAMPSLETTCTEWPVDENVCCPCDGKVTG